MKAKVLMKRIKEKDRKHDKFYYETRHNDNSMDRPVTVEKDVLVNFYGTLELDFELNFKGKKAITFKEFREQEKKYLKKV